MDDSNFRYCLGTDTAYCFDTPCRHDVPWSDLRFCFYKALCSEDFEILKASAAARMLTLWELK